MLKYMDEEIKVVPKMYYGAHEIVNVETNEDVSKRVQIVYKTPKINADGSSDVGEKFDIPEWELLVCTHNEPCTEMEHLSYLRNCRANYVVKKMLELFKDCNVRVNELTFYSQKLVLSMQMNEQDAINKSFGVADESDIRIMHWDKVLKS